MNARRLAEWAIAYRAGDDALAAATDLLLDFVGVLLASAAEEESSKVACRYAKAFPAGEGGTATLLGDGARVAPEAAAFAHAAAGHGIELDDVHNASSLHPGVVAIPAALAAGEAAGADGRALLEAIVVGYEAAIRVGEAAGPAELYARGFHPTAVCGPFGAALAAARLGGLSVAEATHALGLAWSFASGNMSFQTEGSWAKRLQVGGAAAAGLRAARLAGLGATGPARALEADGFFHSHSGRFDPAAFADFPETNPPADGATPGAARGARGERIFAVGIKPYACCRYNQAPVDTLLEMKREREIDPANVESARVEIARAGLPLVAFPDGPKRRPANPVEAQFSLYHSAAVAIVAGAAGRAQYRDPWLADPRVRDLAARVEAAPCPEADRLYPAKWPARVVVRMRDGEIRERFVEECLGDPEKPMTREALLAKFDALLAERYPAERREKIARGILATASSGTPWTEWT